MMARFGCISAGVMALVTTASACGQLAHVDEESGDKGLDGSDGADASMSTDALIEHVDDSRARDLGEAGVPWSDANIGGDAMDDSGLCANIVTHPEVCGPPGGGTFTRPIDLSCANGVALDTYCSSLHVPNEGPEWGILLDGGLFECVCSGPG
jgi:hypothetical protein